MKLLYSLLALLALCGASWGQRGTYPDGSPWEEVPAIPGYAFGPEYQTARPPAPEVITGTQGDGRMGFLGAGAFWDFIGIAPLNPYDYGSMTVNLYNRVLWNGETVTNNILWQRTRNAVWDSGIVAWIPETSVTVDLAGIALSGRFPPGRYEVEAGAADSRGNSSMGSYRGWFCPKLIKILVTVLQNGRAVKNFNTVPVAIVPAFGSAPVPAWRRGVTDNGGGVHLLVPSGCRITFLVDNSSDWQGGQCTGFWDVPGDLPDGFAAGTGGEASKELRITLYTDRAPALDEASSSNSADNSGGFWSDLWVPAPEKLTQFSSEVAHWSAWGPFGLVGSVAQVWGAGVVTDDEEAKYAGLVWDMSGVLGSSKFDLRPLRQAPAAPYPDGLRGSLGGGALSVVRLLVGLVVWAGALFGTYRYLSPKMKA